MRLRIDNNFISRFESKFVKKSGCWIWEASLNNKGYGQFSIKRSVNKLAHRISYQIYIGDIPKGLCVLHKCDNPKCVNPDHLFLGTKKDNMIDKENKNRGNHEKASKTMIRKGHNRGEKQWMCKLTNNDIIEIRKLHSKGLTHEEIASKYPVERRQIGKIINKESWKHLK